MLRGGKMGGFLRARLTAKRVLKSIVNREKGFHFLRLLHHWGDEIWIHEEFPGFTRAMSVHAVTEPVTRSWDAYHADGRMFQTLNPSYAACVELSKEHARKIIGVNKEIVM